MVPTIASTITIVVVTPTQPICNRGVPAHRRAVLDRAGGLAERQNRVDEEHDDAELRSGSG